MGVSGAEQLKNYLQPTSGHKSPNIWVCAKNGANYMLEVKLQHSDYLTFFLQKISPTTR